MAVLEEIRMNDNASLMQNPSQIMKFENGDPIENPWVGGSPAVEEIEVSAYSPRWPAIFETAKAAIIAALPVPVFGIAHIGSTAVPDLAAKPVIDIDLIVADPDDEDSYTPALTALGYVLTVRERSWYQHRMLRHAAPRINLHIFGRNCPEHLRHLLFRDWLRKHPEDRDCYSRAKRDAKIGVLNVQDYNQRKQAVIMDIYRKIFEGRGWNAAK
jgi:GrpB-like predicted nucleotidyltransferase (UPF0157 family)